MMFHRCWKILAICAGLTGVPASALVALEASPVPGHRPYEIYVPELRWDETAKGRQWSQAVMGYLNGHGRALTEIIPNDINDYCPGYAQQDKQGRAAFWAGLISSLSFHESTWNERAVGGGGLWFGLTQIAPPTADWRKCNVRSAEGLKDGKANLSCAVRIMAITVPRDKVVSRGMRGVAADWGPFHSKRKREDMMRWSKAQPYCARDIRISPIPMFRPSAGDQDSMTLEAPLDVDTAL